MWEKLLSFSKQNELFQKSDSILLAVSGGVDSVVMTDLFVRGGISAAILHCNFQLRGNESELDEAFVRSLADSYNIPIFVQRFDTEIHANENGISVQMAARELRYKWFDEMRDYLQYDHIATAHNKNDAVETFFINLGRGTGIKGITGIPVKNNHYIRPLLFLSRKDIYSYARVKGLAYREDSSNASKKYQRNKIRHDIIPAFEELNPSFVDTMEDNIHRFSDIASIYKSHINSVRKQLFSKQNHNLVISISDIKKLSPIKTWLYELFHPFNFTKDQCSSIAKILDAPSGKVFISTTHKLYKDRDAFYIVENNDNTNFERYYIDSTEKNFQLPFAAEMEILETFRNEDINNNKIAFLDMDTLHFPLTVRKWMHGDYFYPLGMDHIKKVSDFFIDNKIPVPVKKNTWILASGKNIVWIIGLRIDNRYKVTDHTKKVLKLKIYDD